MEVYSINNMKLHSMLESQCCGKEEPDKGCGGMGVLGGVCHDKCGVRAGFLAKVQLKKGFQVAREPRSYPEGAGEHC